MNWRIRGWTNLPRDISSIPFFPLFPLRLGVFASWRAIFFRSTIESRPALFWGLLAALCSLQAAPAAAQGVFREGFEGPETSWQVAGSDAAYRIAAHRRTREDAHAGDGCEVARLVCNNGSYVHFRHWIAPARLIRELTPSLWIKADRPGLRMYVRVVLPRSQDPRTGKPVTTMLAGPSYDRPGVWQQLRVCNLPELLARNVRVLRAELGPQVDPREAYIDQVLLNIYGGPGTTTVFVDQLEVSNVIAPGGAVEANWAEYQQPSSGSPATPAAAAAPARQARLRGPQLVVDGRPIFPRVVVRRGEPLAALRQLGFNIVQLSQPPTPEILSEARRLGVWLIAPAPPPAELEGGLSDEYEPVIAWSLGTNLSGQDLERVRGVAQALRRGDPRPGRPLIADCQSDLRGFSRVADVLVIGGGPLGASMELSDYARWLAERPQFARPGTPIWCRVQTDYDAAVHAQWSTLAGGPVPGVAIDAEQLRFLVYASLAAGARGLVFDSHASLTAADAGAEQRRLALELTNLELQLIEPWAVGGGARTSARSSDPNVTGVMLQTERSRLVLPLAAARGDQFVPFRAPAGPIAFVVPGVPVSNNAYKLTPAGMPPLRHQRVTGGIRVTQQRSDACSMMLMTADPRIISSLAHQIARLAPRAAELKRAQAARQMDHVARVLRGLPPSTTGGAESQGWFEAARAALAQCNVLWAARDYAGAYREGRRALGALGRVQRARWREALETWPAIVTSPFGISFDTLPGHVRFAGVLRGGRLGASLLPEGDFENLDQMLRVGWKHVEHETPGVAGGAQLSPIEPREGRSSLRLKAWPTDAENPSPAVETPPVWVTSPPVPLEAGQIVKISGWARVPEKISGGVGGLLIVDSLGGPTLALRLRETTGWQEFTLYRVAPQSGPMTVTFALTGLGEAWLDQVRVGPVEGAPGALARRTSSPAARR